MFLLRLLLLAHGDEPAPDEPGQCADPETVDAPTCDDPSYDEAPSDWGPNCPDYYVECDDFEETRVLGDYVYGCCTARSRQRRRWDADAQECEVVDEWRVSQTECHAYGEDALEDCEYSESEEEVFYDGEACPDRILSRTGLTVVHESSMECCATCTFYESVVAHLVEPNSQGDLWECRVGDALFTSQVCDAGECIDWPDLGAEPPEVTHGGVEGA